MATKILNCIDYGSENCPCYMAETRDCLVCSMLRGESCEECNWKGFCVYNEFIQNGNKPSNVRKYFSAPIIYRKLYGEDIVVIGLKVGKGFALKCKEPGSYVFLKAEDKDEKYNIPISVMDVDLEKGTIYLTIKKISIKSKLIFEERNVLEVKGVYRNGIIGIKNILSELKEKQKKHLIIARGLGIAPCNLLLKWINNRSQTDILIDTNNIDEEWARECLKAEFSGIMARINLEEDLPKNRESGLYKTILASSYDRIIILTSDYYIEQINSIIETDAQSNNFIVCCGEGICGACSYITEKGEVIKMCKCGGIECIES